MGNAPAPCTVPVDYTLTGAKLALGAGRGTCREQKEVLHRGILYPKASELATHHTHLASRCIHLAVDVMT